MYDEKSSLVYMNARWYNPSIGRFTSADTYTGSLMNPQSQNRYSYVMNNPVNYTDPTGHVPSWVTNEQDYKYNGTVHDAGEDDEWYYRYSYFYQSTDISYGSWTSYGSPVDKGDYIVHKSTRDIDKTYNYTWYKVVHYKLEGEWRIFGLDRAELSYHVSGTQTRTSYEYADEIAASNQYEIKKDYGSVDLDWNNATFDLKFANEDVSPLHDVVRVLDTLEVACVLNPDLEEKSKRAKDEEIKFVDFSLNTGLEDMKYGVAIPSPTVAIGELLFSAILVVGMGNSEMEMDTFSDTLEKKLLDFPLQEEKEPTIYSYPMDDLPYFGSIPGFDRDVDIMLKTGIPGTSIYEDAVGKILKPGFSQEEKTLDDYIYYGTGNSRNKPKQKGEVNSVEAQYGDNGELEKYTEFDENGNFKKEVRVTGKDHGDVPRPNVKEPIYNINPRTGETFQNGYRVRPAEPWELNLPK